jgi:hypothetical protein
MVKREKYQVIKTQKEKKEPKVIVSKLGNKDSQSASFMEKCYGGHILHNVQ